MVNRVKVLSIIGSYRNANSYSRQSAIYFGDALNHYGECINEILLPNELQINNCIGCCRCFSNGKCSLTDDMNIIISKMMASDIVIFSVPVYFHQISGYMKTLIDRLAFLSHIMYFLGKIGVVIINTDNNGSSKAKHYLKEVQEYLGFSCKSCFTVYTNNLSEEAHRSIIKHEVTNLVYELHDGTFASELQHQFYKLQMNSMKNRPDQNNEKIMWQNLFSNKEEVDCAIKCKMSDSLKEWIHNSFTIFEKDQLF